jgi:hypothetical protein
MAHIFYWWHLTLFDSFWSFLYAKLIGVMGIDYVCTYS